MVVNDIGLAEDHDIEDLAYIVPRLVLHELAHIFVRPALYEDRSGVDPNRLKFEALVVADVTKRPVRDDLPAYFGHGHSFIRIALHLCHRAEQAGVHVSPTAICAGYRYGLPHASQYREALADEPACCADWLFRDILATKPPRAFAKLWTDDVVSYHQRFPLQKGSAP